jgi:protein SCO1/2
MTINRLKFPLIGLTLLIGSVALAWGQSDMHDHAAVGDHNKMNMHDHAAHGDHSMHMQEHASAGDHAMHSMGDHGENTMHAMSADEHAAHRAALAKSAKSDFKVSMENYAVPDVELVDDSGTPVALRTLLSGGHPVAVNFIFTTCTTICPVMTATFAQMRKELGSEADRIQLVSITIDPEHDTPAVLAQYAKRFDATTGWQFLTGSPADVERVLRTFDAWTGSKTNHRPITLLRSQGDSQWVRLEGLGSGIALAEQARTVIQ